MKTSNSIMKGVAASVAAMSLAAAAFAGETVHVDKNPPPMPLSYYNAHEIQLGISALFAARAGDDRIANAPLNGVGLLNAGAPIAGVGVGLANERDDHLWGADVDLQYFITRNIGIGIEQQWINDGRPIWNTAANVILRAPLSEGSRWAPYLFGGAGAVYAASHGRFEGHAGAGLEYRFTPKIGTFFDGRYVWVNGKNDNVPQYGAFRAGFRFVF
jgi:hypothetical protein